MRCVIYGVAPAAGWLRGQAALRTRGRAVRGVGWRGCTMSPSQSLIRVPTKNTYIYLQRPPRLIPSDVGAPHPKVAVRDPSEFGGSQIQKWSAGNSVCCSRTYVPTLHAPMARMHRLGRAPTLVVILISEMAGRLCAHDGSVGRGCFAHDDQKMAVVSNSRRTDGGVRLVALRTEAVRERPHGGLVRIFIRGHRAHIQ